MPRPDPVVLDNHGERMVPETANADTFWEHVNRYRFAASYVRGKRVLDIACGEGYGAAALLRAGAASVIGIDVSPLAVENAKQRYSIDARVGDAESIPLPDQSVEMIVSFETVEHVPHPERFIAECRRVLTGDGVLIVSTPNQGVYREGDTPNPFHLSEMTAGQFKALIGTCFRSQSYWAQCPQQVAWWPPRILHASDAQLRAVRGRLRLRRMLQRLIDPELASGPSARQRENPVEAILAPRGRLRSLVDPYAIRPLRTAERPTYLIALARV